MLAARGVRASHERTYSVVDKRRDPDRETKVVDLSLQQGADILTNGIRDVETLGPADQLTLIDTQLLNGEAEGETQTEDVLVTVTLGCTGGLAAADMAVEAVGMVFLQEELNLLSEEGKQVAGLLGDHEMLGDGNFVVGEIEGSVTIEHDGADTEVGTAEIDGQIETLGRVAVRFGPRLRRWRTR